MGSGSGKRSTLLIICGLAVAAVAINYSFINSQKTKDDEVAREGKKQKQIEEAILSSNKAVADANKAAEDAKKQHLDYLRRYLNTRLERKPGVATVAVASSPHNNALDSALCSLIDTRFQPDQLRTIPSLFTASFVSDGLFTDALNGSLTMFNELELTNSLDAILLASETVQYSPTPDNDSTISVVMRLELAAVPIASQGRKQSDSFRAEGVGFNREAARAMAEERILKLVATNDLLSFEKLLPNSH